MRRASRLHSWDVFAYERLPNQLRALRLLLGLFSSGQRQPIMRRALRLHSWDVFAYEPFANQPRPLSLLLGRLSRALLMTINDLIALLLVTLFILIVLKA